MTDDRIAELARELLAEIESQKAKKEQEDLADWHDEILDGLFDRGEIDEWYYNQSRSKPRPSKDATE